MSSAIRDEQTARIQDVVAALSHVRLRPTVKVLRSLAMAAQSLGHKQLAAELNEVLLGSANQGSFPAPLHSKPEHAAVEACTEAISRVVGDFGEAPVENMRELSDDPYFDNRINPFYEKRLST